MTGGLLDAASDAAGDADASDTDEIMGSENSI
jgi:hypothetical protein